MNTSSTRVPAGTSSRRLRSRRTKTFSGCGTCRTRHLKCDEARPACQRCIDAKLECSGYPGYRAEVLWRPVRGPSNFRSLTQPAYAPNDPAAQSSAHDVPHRSSEHIQSLSFPRLERTDREFPGLGGPLRLSPENALHFSPPAVSTPSLSVSFINHNSYLTTTGVNRHLDLLEELNLQRQLIEHWINHLSDALMPVPGLYNPLKTIFVPIAYSGARCPASSSSGSVALFYLICASSAYHLSANSSDDKRSEELMTLALRHHNEGIRHLQRSLARDDPHERESVLASLLVCLIYEPVTVEQNFWQNHLRGASQWLRKIDVNALVQTESITILYQMFAGTAILLRSQMLSSGAALDECIGYDLKLFSGPYHLYRIFGLPKHLLEAVSDIIEEAAQLRQRSRETPSVYDMVSSQQLDKKELELCLSVPEYPEGLTTTPRNDLVHHLSWIFYFASVIYFKRVLRNVHPDEVQLLIEQAFDHIDALRTCTTRPSSPLTWPIAVIFFEAKDPGLQKRAMDWLDFIIKRSTLSVWQRAKPLFPDFWARRRNPGNGDMQWDIFLDDPSIQGFMML